MEGGPVTTEPKGRPPLWNRDVVEDIWNKATLGRYRIQGGATRLRVPVSTT